VVSLRDDAGFRGKLRLMLWLATVVAGASGQKDFPLGSADEKEPDPKGQKERSRKQVFSKACSQPTKQRQELHFSIFEKPALAPASLIAE
jgi:hypothetical protein